MTTAKATAADTWAEVSKAIGYKTLAALHGYWYGKQPLPPDAEQRLRDVFARFPLGAPSFKAWLNQRLRQLQGNAAMVAATSSH